MEHRDKDYKRLEIYTGWKCNHKCVFCIEYPNMDIAWDNEVSKKDVMKKLIKYAKQGYDHVTFLGGEPFIHPVFGFATKFARKIGYTVMVTTNASTIQFDAQAKKHLPNVDQLLISVPIINPEKQLVINGTKGVINFEKVFENIDKYWDGNFLKINTVINTMNLDQIGGIIEFMAQRKVKHIALTYPDIVMPYYSKEHILTKVAPKYSEVKKWVPVWFKAAEKYDIHIQIVDVPFCNLPDQKYFAHTDDYKYQTRLKIQHTEEELHRDDELPRRRWQIAECKGCKAKSLCWGPSIHYEELFGLSEIKKITKLDVDMSQNDFLKNQSKSII